MKEHVVIVGSGQAGVQAAFSLRTEGFTGDITLLGDEAALPYQRPPLSKAYLLGKMDDEGVLMKSPSAYEDYKIDLVRGVRGESIDRAAGRLRLSDGRDLAYDHLVLATGAGNRDLPVPGKTLKGVLNIRTIEDARALMKLLPDARRAVVVGAGFIGLEFAAVARSKGIEVLIVELAPRPMGRALSAEMARFFEEKHIAWGSKFLFGAGVTAFHGQDRVTGVELGDGTVVEAELAIVGIGAIPNVELAKEAGLEIGDGIVVNDMLLTSDPAISAIGDSVWHPNRYAAGGFARVESVQNATDQARFVAMRLAGKPQPYDAVPWFWSDQGDLKLQIAGLATGHDTAVVRGDPATGAFSIFCFQGERLLGVESVNSGADHVMARRLLTANAPITAEQAADTSTPLKSYLVRPAA